MFEIAYLARYANQSVSEILAMPNGFRRELLESISSIIEKENPES